jgi:hypothetical protein
VLITRSRTPNYTAPLPARHQETSIESAPSHVPVPKGQRSQCAILTAQQTNHCATLSYMATTNRTEFERLILRIERDLLTESQLKALLTVAEVAVADGPKRLLTIKARIKRTRH